MKRNCLINLLFLCVMIIFLTSSTTEDTTFYYAFDKKIPLVAKHNTVLVKYDKAIGKEKATESLRKFSPNAKIKWHDSSIAEITDNTRKSINSIIENLQADETIYSCQPFYTLKDGLEMGVTDEILVSFLPKVTQHQQEMLYKKFDIQVVKTTKIYQKLKVKKRVNALEIANKIYETGLVEFSTPNFVSHGIYHQVIPNDTYFNRQIACHNTGQVFTDGHSGTSDADIDAPEAWEITTGKSDIIVAVLDQGVTPNHPDLPNTRQVRLNGSNFNGGNVNDPSPTVDGNHGNACAGVIAATMNNNQGIAGIASGVRIMPVRLPDNFNTDIVADAIEFAVDNGANILSNSWGYGTSNQNAHPVIISAINYALSNNRVVVFAAGNEANQNLNDVGYVSFPANANIPNLITVGASDRNDRQANYSPTSNLIDIVAPSNRSMPWQSIAGETYEMWSIDIPGNAGYNPWSGPLTPPAIGEINPNFGVNNLDYTARFGGTSHSCPVVAGVVALMLSVNPYLYPQQVFDILMESADDVGGYTYINGRCNQMGHGRVNAYHAVIGALEKLPISGASMLCNQETYTIQNPPGTTVQWTTGSNISIVSGQGTSSVTVKKSTTGDYGQGSISANILLNGTVVTTASRIIDYVGTPVVTSISGQTYLNAGSSASYYANPHIISNGIQYKWYVSPSSVSTSPWNNTNYITFYQAGTYYVSCQIISPCGFGSAGSTIVTVTGNGGYYSVYPNPATDMVTVQMAEETAETNTLSMQSSNKGLTSSKYEIQIWNSVGIIKKFTTEQNTYQISVADLYPGIYFVHIIKDGKVVYRQKLIKN